MNVLAVFIGGGLGSLARYGISVLLLRSSWNQLPVATFVSNILACLVLLSMLVLFREKITNLPWLAPLMITGFCGGFSTFSTFSLETANLLQHGNYGWAAANILLSLSFGIGVFLWFKA